MAPGASDMNGTALFFAGLLTGLVLAGGAFYGLYAHARRKRGAARSIVGYLDLLPDLSGAQREKVQEIRRTFLPRVEGIRRNLRRERAELARLLFAEPKDLDAVYRAAEQVLDHQTELEREVIEHILEEQEMLTPSQKRRFYEIIVEQFASGGLGVHDVRGRD